MILPGSNFPTESMILAGHYSYTEKLMKRPEAILIRLRSMLSVIPKRLSESRDNLAEAELSLEAAKAEYGLPFEYEDALTEAERVLREINGRLFAGAV